MTPTDSNSHRSNGWLRWLLLLVVSLLFAASAYSWQSEGIVRELTRSDRSAADKVASLQTFFRECGVCAPLVYVGFVMVEVIIAPIPGLMLYAPGGLIFGPILGGLLALIGNVLGAGFACRMTRGIIAPWTQSVAETETIAKIQTQLQQRGSWLIFWLRVNPLTSSDLVSYAAGLTRIPIWQVMLATACGMAPLCFVQSWLSESVFTAFPKLIYPLLGAGLVYLCVVIVLLFNLKRKA